MDIIGEGETKVVELSDHKLLFGIGKHQAHSLLSLSASVEVPDVAGYLEQRLYQADK